MQNYVPIVSRGHLNNQPHSLGLVDSKINPTHEPWVGMSPINLTVWGWYIETLKKFALLKSANDDGSAWERLLIAFCLAHTDGFWRQGPGPSRFEVY